MPHRDPEKRRECGREVQRRYYAKHGEVIRAKRRKTYRLNAEVERAKRREYGQRPEVKARAAEYAREYRRRNPIRERARRWAKKGAPTQEREYGLILLADPCCYCGAPAGEVDHITPVAAGGTSEWTNLTAACPFCNRSKKDRSLLLWMLNQKAAGKEP